MLIIPEAGTAILRTAAVSAVAIICIVGAIRADCRWVRILLAVVAIPISLLAVFGLIVIWLIMQYGHAKIFSKQSTGKFPGKSYEHRLTNSD